MTEASEVASTGRDEESRSTITPEPTSGSGGGGTRIRVAIPTNDNLQFISFWTALGAGFFEDEGLDVQTVFPPMPSMAGQFMLQGRADIGLLPPPMYLPMIADEEPVVIFANLLSNDQINLIVRQDFAAENGLSTDLPLKERLVKKRLEAISDFKVGVAPGPPTKLRVPFDSVGLDADSDIEIVIVLPHDQNDTFGDGSIDALYGHTPFLERALVQQDAIILVNQLAGEVPELSGRQSHSLVAPRSYAMANRDDLVALTRAIHRAQQLIRNDEEATVEALLASGVPDLEQILVETIVHIYSPAVPESPVVSVEGLEKALELFPAHLTPPDFTGIDFQDYVALGIAVEASSP